MEDAVGARTPGYNNILRRYVHAPARALGACEASSPAPALGRFLPNLDPTELRRLGREVRHATKKHRWRRFVARRNSFLSLTLRKFERMLEDRFTRREKTDATWVVYGLDYEGTETKIASIGPTNPRTWEQLCSPAGILLHRADLLDHEGLVEWKQRLMATWGDGLREPSSCARDTNGGTP